MKHNKILAFVLVLALVAGIAPAHAAGGTFSDVPPSHWAYDDVQTAAADGVINGVGNGKFSPDGVLTIAEWSCILARGFYADEVENRQKENWYNREIEVLWEHGIYANVGTLDSIQFSAPASRALMAETVANLMKDKDVTVNASKIAAAKSEIADLETIYPMHHEAVGICWALDIINGVGGGRFDGSGYVQRGAAAAVYNRTKKALQNGGQITAPAPEPITTPAPEPTPSGPVAGNVVGTMSSVPVTINADSIKTHAPVVDYWSSQPADIRAIADKDSFNAACQTIHDSEMILTQGEMGKGIKHGVNLYYNYAVVSSATLKTQKNVDGAMGALSGYGGGYNSYGSSYVIYTLTPLRDKTVSAPRFSSTIAQINVDPSMSDRQKVELCVKAVCDQLDYQVDGGASWDNGGTKGDCTSYSRMLAQLLSAAGIPNIHVAATVTGGNHAWVQAALRTNDNNNGGFEWVILDAVATDARPNNVIITFEQHASANMFNYDVNKNNADPYKVARALVGAAWPSN